MVLIAILSENLLAKHGNSPRKACKRRSLLVGNIKGTKPYFSPVTMAPLSSSRWQMPDEHPRAGVASKATIEKKS